MQQICYNDGIMKDKHSFNYERGDFESAIRLALDNIQGVGELVQLLQFFEPEYHDKELSEWAGKYWELSRFYHIGDVKNER